MVAWATVESPSGSDWMASKLTVPLQRWSSQACSGLSTSGADEAGARVEVGATSSEGDDDGANVVDVTAALVEVVAATGGVDVLAAEASSWLGTIAVLLPHAASKTATDTMRNRGTADTPRNRP